MHRRQTKSDTFTSRKVKRAYFAYFHGARYRFRQRSSGGSWSQELCICTGYLFSLCKDKYLRDRVFKLRQINIYLNIWGIYKHWV